MRNPSGADGAWTVLGGAVVLGVFDEAGKAVKKALPELGLGNDFMASWVMGKRRGAAERSMIIVACWREFRRSSSGG